MTIDPTHSVIFKRFGTAMIHPLRPNDECARQCTGASLVLLMLCYRSLVQPMAWCHKTQAIALSVLATFFDIIRGHQATLSWGVVSATNMIGNPLGIFGTLRKTSWVLSIVTLVIMANEYTRWQLILLKRHVYRFPCANDVLILGYDFVISDP